MHPQLVSRAIHDVIVVAQAGFWDTEFAISIFPELLEGLRTTVYISIVASVVALGVGMVLAVLRMSDIRLVSRVVATTIEFVRSTPVLVQLYFVFYVFPKYGMTLSAEVTGIGVLGFHYSTYMSEVYRAGINSVPQGQWDASRALNFTLTRTWVTLILPQAIPPMIPALGNYLNEMFKATPILLAITIVELLATAQNIGSRSFRYFEALTLAGLLYLVVSLAASLLVEYAERKYQTVNGG